MIRRWVTALLALAAALLDRLDPPSGQHAPMVPGAVTAEDGTRPEAARLPAPPRGLAPLPPRGSPARGEHPYPLTTPPLAYPRPDGFILLTPDGCVSVLPEPRVIPPWTGTTHPDGPDRPGQPGLHADERRRLAIVRARETTPLAIDPDPVPPWYRAWLAEHPEAGATA